MNLPKPGDVLAGKYRIVRVLGEGGMGVVYEAVHTRLNNARLAIKMLQPDMLDHPTVVERFEREARVAATIESRHVAKVLDVDAADGVPYMVIEFLEGHDLATELAECGGRMPIPLGVSYVLEACVPIGLAHANGIVHRDLKPSNLFIVKSGQEKTLKLIDFGISKIKTEEASKLTSPLDALGTPHYMSPEQMRDAAAVDHRSDIWSLGIILYELLTGQVPFDGAASSIIARVVTDPIAPPRTLNPDIPIELDQAIMRALEKDPAKRFADVRSFAEALAPFVLHETPEISTMHHLKTLPPPQPMLGDKRTQDTWARAEKPQPRRSLWIAAPLLALALGALVVVALRVRPAPVAASVPTTATTTTAAQPTTQVITEPAKPRATSVSPPEKSAAPAPTPTPAPVQRTNKRSAPRPTTDVEAGALDPYDRRF